MDELINPPDPTGGLVASGPSGTTGGTADTWVPENEGPGRFAGHVSDPNANDVLADMLRPIRDEIPELRESLNEVLDLLSGIGRRGRN
jgi:hypothetical protein